eukprot:MONOS_1947.1-p1 / transcript=MONOS_1947.1 / gene=MONOS_1947 / organism=Monocercomonoides_exilis_PA203 / gene_product=unspecified product / transcript_product=unspecified product / location=Mono_scaffold00037:102133-106202(-) / protein_length=1319 / sequence_SO=supercontig / SO=protein_coding / is_pseudo=false
MDPLFIAQLQNPNESKKPLVKFCAQFRVAETFYIWGGWQNTGISNSLWSFDFSTCIWKEVDEGEIIPEARYSMAYAVCGSNLYIFGGASATGLLNDIWKFDLQTKQWIELKIDQRGNDPEPCSGAGMLVSNGYAVVYGGDTGEDIVSKLKIFRVKIDAFSPQSWEAVKLTDINGNESNIPDSRTNFGHATFISSNKAYSYIFSGHRANNVFELSPSLLILDCGEVVSDEKFQKTARYKEIAFKENYWLQTCDCRCTTDEEGNLFIFGGRNDNNVNSNLVAVMKEDLSFDQTEVNIYSQSQNEQRKKFRKKICNYESFAAIFGDLKDSNADKSSNPYSAALENTWMETKLNKTNFTPIFDPVSSAINDKSPFQTLISTSNFAPSPRVNPIVSFYDRTFLVYGGRDIRTGEILGDFFIFDLRSMSWRKISPRVSSEIPPAREFASCCEDNGRLLLFGGLGPNPLTGINEPSNELWEFSFSSEKWRQLGRSSHIIPEPVYGASSAIYMNYLYVVGGQRIDGSICGIGFAFNFALDRWEQLYNTNRTYDSVILVMNMLIQNVNPLNISKDGNEALAHCRFNSHNTTKNYGTKNHAFFKDSFSCEKSQHFNIINESINTNETLHPTMIITGGVDGETPIIGYELKDLVQPLNDSGEINEYLDNTQKNCNMYDFLKFNATWRNLQLSQSEDYLQIYKHADGVALALDDRVLMIGGRKRTYSQDSVKIIKFDQSGGATVIEDDGTGLTNEMHINLVEAGCTVYHRSIVCFGGRQINKGRTVLPSALDTFRIINLHEDIFPCSPGSYENDNRECIDCPKGSYSNEYGVKECIKCPKGTRGNSIGGMEHACECIFGGAYIDSDGAIDNDFHLCTKEQYCPIGSATSNNTIPTADPMKISQPMPFRTPVRIENYLMIGLYVGFAIIGFAVALFLLCLPTRSHVYKLDRFSDKYSDSLDPVTHASVKQIKKTTLGGFISVIALFFVCGAALLVVLTFAFLNTNEVKAIVDASMEKEANLTTFKNRKILIELSLMDYSGICVGPPENTTSELTGNCSIKMGIGKTIFDPFGVYPTNKHSMNPICSQSPSTNRYFLPTHHCKIILEANNLEFPIKNSYVQFFSMRSQDRRDSCRALKVFASVDSAVPVQHELKFGPGTTSSSTEYVFVSDTDHAFSGLSPTNITIELIPTIYRNEISSVPSVSKGHLVNYISYDVGSLADNMQISYSVGLGINIQLKLDKTVALTRHSMKVTWTMLLTSLGGTFVYLGYFGNVLSIFESILNINWPCGRKVQKNLSTVFNDSLKKRKRTKPNQEYIEEMKSMMEENLTEYLT